MIIAILEDSATLAEMLRIGLELRGHIVKTFHQTIPFIEAVCHDNFDAVICDHGLDEEKSGVEVITQIRATLPDIAALIISGLDLPELKAIERRLGNVPAIQKPFSIAILENTIRKIVYEPRTNTPPT